MCARSVDVRFEGDFPEEARDYIRHLVEETLDARVGPIIEDALSESRSRAELKADPKGFLKARGADDGVIRAVVSLLPGAVSVSADPFSRCPAGYHKVLRLEKRQKRVGYHTITYSTKGFPDNPPLYCDIPIYETYWVLTAYCEPDEE